MNLLESLDFDKIIPTQTDFEKILKAQYLYEKNKDVSGWTKNNKNWNFFPWGLGYNVGPKGRQASKAKAVQFYLIALIINWPDLVAQLERTVKQVYHISKADIQEVYEKVIEPNLNKISQDLAAANTAVQTNLPENLVEALDITTPYMLRNDGALISCGEIHPYIKMYFKDDFEVNYNKLISHPEFLTWFYKNTLLEETRQLIAELLYRMPANEDIIKVIGDLKIEKPEENNKETETIFNQLNDATNQEFCRVRTSNFKYKYGGDNGEIYFRISSKDFNWFDLIWMTVNQFKDQIKFVTIMKDYAATGKQFDYIKDGEHEFNKMPVEEFLTLGGNPVVEELEIEEDIEKHDTLNPKLFENNKMIPEVREKLLRIVDEFTEGLAEDNIPIEVKDIQLVGSNASYNYTKDSDIDLHIIADTTELDDPDELYPIIYNAYRALWNSKYDINTHEIPTEIYVETNEASNISNGCYSILNDEWIKEPVPANIPEIDQEAFDTAFAEWEDRYNEVVNSGDELEEEIHTPKIDAIDQLIQDIYDLRKTGLATEGEYGQGNLIFKEFRNRGYLDRLKELKAELIEKELSLESLNEEKSDVTYDATNNNLISEVLRNISKMEIIVSILNKVTGKDYSYLLEKIPSKNGVRMVPKYIVHHYNSNHEDNILDNLFIVNRNDHTKYNAGKISFDQVEKISLSDIFLPLVEDDLITEDTIKQNGKWVNKGKEGTHGTFKTKKAADAQRKAMFANGWHESLEEDLTAFENQQYSKLLDEGDHGEVKNQFITLVNQQRPNLIQKSSRKFNIGEDTYNKWQAVLHHIDAKRDNNAYDNLVLILDTTADSPRYAELAHKLIHLYAAAFEFTDMQEQILQLLTKLGKYVKLIMIIDNTVKEYNISSWLQNFGNVLEQYYNNIYQADLISTN